MSAPTHRQTRPHFMMTVVLFLVAVLFAHAAFEDAHVRHMRTLLCAQPLELIHAQEGDTIWGIAQHHHVDGVSTYELVTWLYERNELSDSCLFPGQALVVPSSSAGQTS